MSREQINTVVTVLRPMQADFAELVSEINDMWSQLRAVERAKFEEREHIATIVRLNLTDSIEKFQALLKTLSSHISNLDTVLPLKKPMRLSCNFDSDLRHLLDHLRDIYDGYQLQLTTLTDCLEPLELEKPLDERNLYEENYQLSRVIRRIKADLTLISCT